MLGRKEDGVSGVLRETLKAVFQTQMGEKWVGALQGQPRAFGDNRCPPGNGEKFWLSWTARR